MHSDLEIDALATVIVQFPVDGWGTDEEFDRRCRIEELLDAALEASDNGFCDGGDIGSGTANAFLMVKDVSRAVPTILDTLSRAGLLHGVVVAEGLTHSDEVVGFKVWWPENHSGHFSLW